LRFLNLRFLNLRFLNLRFLNLRFHYQFVLREGSWPRNTARAAGLPASAARRSHNCWISVNQLGV
jgi:hypothetical protein